MGTILAAITSIAAPCKGRPLGVSDRPNQLRSRVWDYWCDVFMALPTQELEPLG